MRPPGKRQVPVPSRGNAEGGILRERAMNWYRLVIRFKLGGGLFEEEQLVQGTNERDAQGSLWASILLRYPNAIYVDYCVR